MCEITKCDQDKTGHDLSDGRPPVKLLNEEFQKKIIQQYTSHHNNKIPEQLNSLSRGSLLPYDVPAQVKTCGESDAKRNQECKYVRADGDGTDVNNFFIKDKIISERIQQNVEDRVSAATCRIPEHLQRHKASEGRIETIHQF